MTEKKTFLVFSIVFFLLTAFNLSTAAGQPVSGKTTPSAVKADSLFTIPGVSEKTLARLQTPLSDSRTLVKEIETVLLADKKIPADELCALASFAGTVYEHLGEYSKAVNVFITASANVRSDSDPSQNKRSSLLLSAARCALCAGETQIADKILSDAAKIHPGGHEAAKLRLYASWSWLLKIETPAALHEPLAVLDSYLTLDSMKSVRPSILFTLYYVTGDKKYAEMLQQEYPFSLESDVVQGKAALTPAPFMFFLIRKN